MVQLGIENWAMSDIDVHWAVGFENRPLEIRGEGSLPHVRPVFVHVACCIISLTGLLGLLIIFPLLMSLIMNLSEYIL